LPAKLLYFMLLATFLALAVVWENAALRHAGYRLEQLRAQVAEQRAEQIVNQVHLSKLRNPQRILGLVKWLGLDLCEQSVAQAAVAPEKASGDDQVSTPDERPQPQKAPVARGRLADPSTAPLASARIPEPGNDPLKR
jgi:hypothetical protein